MADKNLTKLSEEELAAYRQAADEEMNDARAKKAAVRDELQRREALALVEGLTDAQKATLRQHIGGVGGIDAGAMGGIGG